jgi:hypothetical protein
MQPPVADTGNFTKPIPTDPSVIHTKLAQIPMKLNQLITNVLAAIFVAVAPSQASPTDLSFPPQSSGGHDFNHAPIGQTFTATAADVTAGIYLSDAQSFTFWLSNLYPGQTTPYPYAVAPSISLRFDILAGEGTGGTVIYTEDLTIRAPYSGFVNVDPGAFGVRPTPGAKYTLLLTDISGQAYPQGVSGWIVPAFTSYAGGNSILQGVLGTDTTDVATGDNCFQVLDNIVTGTNDVITAYVARNPGFIVINGGLNLADHLWTNNLNPTNTVFLDGLVNWYQTGLLVDYTGILTSQGVLLTSLTVKKAVAPLTIAATALTNGVQGVAYTCPLSFNINGGVGPFTAEIAGLPSGLSFDGVNVSGTPTVAGTFAPVATITDARGTTATAALSITIAQPPAPPVTNYTIRDEATGKITAVGSNYLMVGGKKLIWNAATIIKVNTKNGLLNVITSAVKVGQRVQWKGLLDKATNTVLTSQLEIN